jgi:hypothetical protein
MKQLIVKIISSPFIAFFLTLPVIAALQSIMGQAWIRDTLNNSAFGVWIVLTGVLIVAIIIHYFLKGR